MNAETYNQLQPTLSYLQRIGQIIGKYSLERPYYFAWGNIALLATPRGFMTKQYYRPEGCFWFEIDVYDEELKIFSAAGQQAVKLKDGDSIADFYNRFVVAASKVGVHPPISSHETELTSNKPFNKDEETLVYNTSAARSIVSMYSLASAGLEAWQANYIGYSSEVGVMWGGFDLATSRYNGKPVDPPAGRQIFYQNADSGEDLMLGFWIGSETLPPSLYSYITPQPKRIDRVDFKKVGAFWSAKDGLAILPWEQVLKSKDPIKTMVDFGDINYQAAIDQNGWPADKTIERVSGLEASKRLIPLPE